MRRRLAGLLARLLATVAGAGALIVALTVLTALAPSPPHIATSGGAEVDAAEVEAAVGQTVHSYLAWRPQVPGVMISVTAPGVHVEAAAGRRSIGAFLPGRRLSTTDSFRSASATKTFTAAAVLRLYEAGVVGLDDTVDRYLPDELVDRVHVRDGISRGRDITVRQLLNHTSGIYDYGTDPGWMAGVATRPQRAWQPMELLDYAVSHGTPYADPGVGFHYSDTGYVLLGMIIEAVTDQPLAAAYRQLLPMDLLPGTWLEGREPRPDDDRQRASQYAGPLDLTHHDPSYDTFGGGGLVTTVNDLDTFARALFTGKVFSRRETLTTMLATVADDQGGEYGLGIGRRTLAGETVWLHTGFLGSALAFVPALDLSVGITTNQAVAAPDVVLEAVIELFVT